MLDLHKALRAGSGPMEQLLGLVLGQAGHHLVSHLIFILFVRGLLRTPIFIRYNSTTFNSLICLLIEYHDMIFILILLLAPRILITDTLLFCRHTICLTDEAWSSKERTMADGHG